MEEFTPQNLFVIEDLETLRTVADPLRAQIYEYLILAPATIKQVADRLGMTASRLYYHVNMMEKLGLLRVVETRMVANMMEKVYRAIAYSIDIAPHLLNFQTDEGKQAVTEMLTAGLDATREDLQRSLQARLFDLEQGVQEKQRTVTLTRVTARISDEKADDFRRRLVELVEEFTANDAPTTPGQEPAENQNYALMVAFYPSFYFGKDQTA